MAKDIANSLPAAGTAQPKGARPTNKIKRTDPLIYLN